MPRPATPAGGRIKADASVRVPFSSALFTLDGDNHELKMTAEVPGGINQITQWVYGYSVTSPYLLADNDLLAKLELPDPVTGQPSGANSNDQSYTYDDLGETVKDLFDQNGTIRQFNYDVLGRLTMDTVPVLGSGVDLSARSMMYTYDADGQERIRGRSPI